MTLKGPNPVKNIIGGGCDDESKSIGHIFLQLHFFFKKVSEAKINKQATKSDNNEFYEFLT